jgi:hypothetical protein
MLEVYSAETVRSLAHCKIECFFDERIDSELL